MVSEPEKSTVPQCYSYYSALLLEDQNVVQVSKAAFLPFAI